VNREKALILKEADFKADELMRVAQGHVAELETQVRSLKLERVRLLQDMDALLSRSRRFLQEEAPDMFPSPGAARRQEEREAHRQAPPNGAVTVPAPAPALAGAPAASAAPAAPAAPGQPRKVPQAFLRKPAE
jgi:hypothetical protein